VIVVTEPTDISLVESLLTEYITNEFAPSPEFLPIKQDTSLLESRILDSLSILKLVLFIEKRFGVVVAPDELVPENFETIALISSYLRKKNEARVDH
jgi:acyl carrier protein